MKVNSLGETTGIDFHLERAAKIVKAAKGNFDDDPAEEWVVAEVKNDNTVLLTFWDGFNPPRVLAKATAGEVLEISLAKGNFDNDPQDEVVLACVQKDGKLATMVFDSNGRRLSKGVGGLSSDVHVVAGQFDADPYDEYVVVLRQADGTLAAISFNHDGTRLGKGVGGVCSNLGVAAGNFDNNPNDDEYVVSLIQSDGKLAAITFQGNGARIGKGVGGLCSDVTVAAGNFRSDNDPQDEYVVSLIQADGTLAAITFYADGKRIGKGVGGACFQPKVTTGRFDATAPLDGYAVSLKQADGSAAVVFFTAKGVRIGKYPETWWWEYRSLDLVAADVDGCGVAEGVLAFLDPYGQPELRLMTETGSLFAFWP